MIYFIKNISNGQIKIGFADSPNKRLTDLQTGSSDRLVLIKSIEGDRAAEAELHKQFALHRLNGEWFTPADEIVQFIRGKNDKSLEGKFFHSFKDGKLIWQGYVVAEQTDGFFLVQLFEWVMGEPSVQKVMHLRDMADWEFYGSEDEWTDAYREHSRRSRS